MHDSWQFKDFIGGLQGFVMIWTHAARALSRGACSLWRTDCIGLRSFVWMECLSFVKRFVAGCLKQRSI